MEPEECGTFDVGSTTLDVEANGPLTTGVEEATHTVRMVGTEGTDVLRPCGGKGSVVGVMIRDQIELVEGVLEDITSLRLYSLSVVSQ